MLKILAITSHYPPLHGGGYGLHMSWFCEGLANRGHSVAVVTSAPDQSPTYQEQPPIPVFRTLMGIGDEGSSPSRLLQQTLHNVAAVSRAVQDVRPDVIFCGGFDGIGFNAYHAAVESGIPTFTWLGDTWLCQAWRDLRRYDSWARLTGPQRGIRGWVKRLYGWYGRKKGLYNGPKPRTFGRVAAISSFVLQNLRQSGAPVPDDTAIVPVCLHEAFQKSNTAPIGHSGVRTPHLRALFVGRMERLKGPDAALRALGVAIACGADVQLTFAGLRIDESKTWLTSTAMALGVADRVTWAGTPSQGELAELYRNHDVFLFPSRIVEGLGVVNCEALACGLPVIGTADSGAADVIISGTTGFRVAIDDTDTMGQHLAELQSDRDLLTRLSASAVQFSHRFLAGRILDQLESEIYRVTHKALKDKREIV